MRAVYQRDEREQLGLSVIAERRRPRRADALAAQRCESVLSDGTKAVLRTSSGQIGSVDCVVQRRTLATRSSRVLVHGIRPSFSQHWEVRLPQFYLTFLKSPICVISADYMYSLLRCF